MEQTRAAEDLAGGRPDVADGLMEAVAQLVLAKGHVRRAEPFKLSSGELSHHYIDAKAALSRAEDLRLVATAALRVVERAGIDFDVVGGLTQGADALAVGIAWVSDKAWFSVRKEPKRHGKQKLVEGASLAPGVSVLLVDDIVTFGGSIDRAFQAISETGATVEAAVTVVDRGGFGSELFAARRVPYFPLVTYRELGIPPVGNERDGAQAG